MNFGFSVLLLLITYNFWIVLGKTSESIIEHVHMESMKMRDSVIPRFDVKPHPDTMHELTFAIKQNNVDKLHDMLMERTTPGRPLYQQWMSNDEIRALTSNSAAADALMSWFSENGIMIDWVNRGQEYFRVKASIETWEQLLRTTFNHYEEVVGDKIVRAIRAEFYSLPALIASYVETVFGAIDFPVQSRKLGIETADRKVTRSQPLPTEQVNYLAENIVSDADTVPVAGYVQLNEFSNILCRGYATLAYDFAIGPCIPYRNSIGGLADSLQFTLTVTHAGEKVTLSTFSDSACQVPLVGNASLPEYGTCSTFNNQLGVLSVYLGTTTPPLPQFNTSDNFEAFNFYEGPCTGSPPVVVEFLPISSCTEDFTCSSDTYQQSGFNSPVNKTTSCISGVGDVGITSPLTLNAQYEVPIKAGSSSASQSVFSTGDQYFATSDLERFQGTYSIPSYTVTAENGHTIDTCFSSYDCSVGNLEVQYISGLSQGTNTTYWYVASNVSSTDVNLQYLIELLDLSRPPMVNVITYGASEHLYTSSFLNQYSNEAIKAGLMGVTLVVAAGDSGTIVTNACNASAPATYSNCACLADSSVPGSSGGYGYFPIFPASCPYVTAVGATQLFSKTSGEEISASSRTGSDITTGGGFSAYYSSLGWQTSAITGYFDGILSGYTIAPASGYNKRGRGYPDVSINGYGYNVIARGFSSSITTTSASATLFAAMLSNVNVDMIAAGKGPVGFVNPTLYAYSSYFNDIIRSNNLCSQTPPQVETESGFYASSGWDPVSGLGSIQYYTLQTLFVSPPPLSSSPSSNANTLSSGAVAGIVIAVLIVVGILGFLIYSKLRGSGGTVSFSTSKATMKAPLISEMSNDGWSVKNSPEEGTSETSYKRF